MNLARHRFALTATMALSVVAGACTAGTQGSSASPPPEPPATCSPVSATSGCIAGSLSYSCTGDRPDDGDPDLVCDDGTPGAGGATLYCCAPYGQWATGCAPGPSLPGCGAESIGFSCTGATSPDQADTSLVCSAPSAGEGAARDYCCVSFEPSSAICRCASFDEASGMCGGTQPACGAAAIGFACAPGHTPAEVNPLLDCAAVDGGRGAAYCCRTP